MNLRLRARTADPDQQSQRERYGRSYKLFGGIASRTSQAAGRASTFIIAVTIVVVWDISGRILIQNSQNRDGAALQVKLDELIQASAAQNSFVGIEHLTDEELAEIRAKCEARAQQRERHSSAAK